MGLWKRLGEARQGRDARAAAQLQEVRASLFGDRHLITVTGGGRPSRKGTMAYIRYDDGSRDDAWFWNRTVARGEVLVVRGSRGGAHIRSRECLYVNQIEHALPRDIYKRAARHHRRQVL